MATQLSELARELQQEDNDDAVLPGIVQGALELIPGTVLASLSLVAGRKKVDSEVASGDLPRQADALQNSTGQGPCLDAAYQERPALARCRGPANGMSSRLYLGVQPAGHFRLFGIGGIPAHYDLLQLG